MSAPSPLAADTSLVTFTVKVEGKEIDDAFQVISIDTWTAVNQVPKARLVLFDGSPATSDFPLSDLATFLPGQRVEIAAGYNHQESAIFRGVIVKQGIEIDQTEGSKLVVDLTDEAIRMTLERKDALFEKIKDGDLIGKLIAANGLKKDVAPTNVVHEEIVQYYATDWDLMLTRAEMNGLLVIADGGKVTVKEPDTRQAPVLVVKYGESILDLEAEMDAASQYAPSAIKSYTWDIAGQTLVEAGPGAVDFKEQGNVSSAELAKVFGVKKLTRQTGGPIAKASLADWSSAELLRSKLAKIRGSVRFQGSARAQAGKTLELAGLGGRFNGTAFISGVHHDLRDGLWLTTASIGLSPRWFAAVTPAIAAPAASGQLPPIQGLQTGIVKQVAKDPEGEFRVLVALPLLQDLSKGVWARLGTLYASNKVGLLFYPEAGDEVIVGFMNEDPRYPVVLGSVYSKKRPPPYPPEEANDQKAIVTRGKLEIAFDDKEGVIEIRTPGKRVVRLDDKGEAISLADANRNTVRLSKDGISLESGKDITIAAQRNVTLKATGDLTLSAQKNAAMEGLQVVHSAKAKFSAKGNAGAEVTSSAILTLRGTLVKIN